MNKSIGVLGKLENVLMLASLVLGISMGSWSCCLQLHPRLQDPSSQVQYLVESAR